MSLNTLVNQIFKEHTEWHMYAAQAKLHQVPKNTLSRLIDKLTESELSDVAIDMAKKDFVEVGLLLRGEFTISSFIDIVENWSKISAFPYKYEIKENVHTFIIQHDMGKKYSLLIKEIYSYLLQETFQKKFEFIITDNTIVFKFSDPY